MSIEWIEFVEACATLGEGMFLATVGADGRPHLAWVMPGFDGEKIWFSTFRHSQKALNLRHGVAHDGEVAVHWTQRPDALAFCRATARLVDDRSESDQLWDSGILPYDLGNFFSSKDDPELQFVELTPTSASLGSLDPTAPRRRWSRSIEHAR